MNKAWYLAVMASLMASMTVMLPTAQAGSVSCTAESSFHVVTVGVTATATLGKAACDGGWASCPGYCAGMRYEVRVEGTGLVDGSIASSWGGSVFASCSGVNFCSASVFRSHVGSGAYCSTGARTVALDVTITCSVTPV